MTITYQFVYDIDSFHQISLLEKMIWGMEDIETTSVYINHAIANHGGICLAAFDGSKIIGFALAFRGKDLYGDLLWSHIAGVHPDYQGQGIGSDLKYLQKEWALRAAIPRICWTFDPLQYRNAYFNIHHLGCTAKKYEENLYGTMQDQLNNGLASDRLIAEWDVHNAGAYQKMSTHYQSLPLLRYDGDKLIEQPLDLATPYLGLEIPENIHQLKKENINLAQAWQESFRKQIQECFSHGYLLIDLIQEQQRVFYIFGHLDLLELPDED